MPGPSCPRIQDVSIGTSTAYGWHPTARNGVMYGLDATFFPDCVFWASAGMRVFENFRAEDRALLPYVWDFRFK